MMRIIGGKYRGRVIKMPGGLDVRPTQDRVREAIFNVIREKIPGSDVLDLYAASGAFGIESFSRGALSVAFVDNNTKCIKAIKDNLASLGESVKTTQILKSEALMAIDRFRKEGRRFDVVFLDPPYYRDIAKNSLIKMSTCDILSQRSFVIAEHFKKDVLPREISGIALFKEKRYGDTAVSFYRKK